MIRRAVVAVALVCAGCTRDVTLPEPPPVLSSGVVSGRVVTATPGRADRVAVKGAVVSLQGSTNTVETDADGRFALDGIVVETGAVLFRLDVDHDGRPEQQRVLSLEVIGAGPGRAVSIGDVALSENARLHGRIRLADRQGSLGGHFGTLVFIPQSPFSTFTADDGSFVLDQLPEGTADLAAFHDGHDVGGVGGLVLQGGADLGLADLVLNVQTSTPTPGRLTGAVHLFPSADATGTALVATSATSGGSGSGSAGSDGTFAISGLAPGVYDLGATHSGYTPALVGNVAVLPGQETTIDVTLGQGVAVSAITRSTPDASVPDAGSSDAGTIDAGVGLACRTQVDCPYYLQCLDGTCQPLCQSAGCGAGQVCDSPTGVCETPCAGGVCAAGQVCDSRGYCRAGCDVSFPCAGGLRCVSGACVAECTPDGGQCGAHQSCQGFQCKADGTCDLDSDCALSAFCVSRVCVARPTAPVDAGAGLPTRFACSAPCDCKMGEVCRLDAGLCLPEDFPTRFLASDGGVGATFGFAPSTPTSSLAAAVYDGGTRVVVAVRDQDSVATPGAVIFGGAGSAIRGGYVSCGANRWVRSELGRSTFFVTVATYPQVLKIVGDPTNLASDITVANLDLIGGANVGTGNDGNLEATFAPRLHVSGVRGQPTVTAGGFTLYVVYLLSTDDALIEDVAQLPPASPQNRKTIVVGTLGGSGTFRRLLLAPGLQGSGELISTSGNTGPMIIEDIDQPSVTMLSGSSPSLIEIGNCPAPVTVRNNHLRFPIFNTPTVSSGAIQLLSSTLCANLNVTGNDFDGRGVIGPYVSSGTPGTVVGVSLSQSAGVFQGNRISMPVMSNATGSTAGPFIGLYIDGAGNGVGRFDISDNRIEGGALGTVFKGLQIREVTTPGRLSVSRLTVDGGTTTYSSGSSYAVQVDNVSGAAGLSITDSDLRSTVVAQGTSCSSASVGLGLDLRPAVVLMERTRITVPSSQYTVGVLQRSGQLEMYSSFVSTGGGTCQSQWQTTVPEAAIISDGASANAQMWLEGNSIEVNTIPATAVPEAALFCQGSASYTTQVFASSNIFGAGQGASHRMAARSGTVACFQPANFSDNYFWTARGGRDPADQIGEITGSDGGVPDARGNIVGESVSPYAGPQPTCMLSAGSPVLGKGDAGVRRDGSLVSVDLNGRPIVAPVDIGACQH